MLYMTDLLTKSVFKTPRCLIASCVATTFAVVLPLIEIKGATVAKFALICIVLAIHKNHTNLKAFAKSLVCFLCVNVFIAGICMAVFDLNGNFLYYECPDDYSVGAIFLSCLIGVFCIKKIHAYITKSRRESKYICDVRICVGQKFYDMKAYRDSGNKLCYKGYIPVVVLSKSDVPQLVQDCKPIAKEKIKIKSISGSEVVNGFIADKIIFSDNSKCCENVAVALSDYKFNGFSLLLNCDL